MAAKPIPKSLDDEENKTEIKIDKKIDKQIIINNDELLIHCLDNGEGDITVKSKNGTFKVISFIVVKKSEIFYEMFLPGSKFKKDDVINLEKYSNASVYLFFQNVYSSKGILYISKNNISTDEANYEVLFELLELFEMYSFPNLVEKLQELLMKRAYFNYFDILLVIRENTICEKIKLKSIMYLIADLKISQDQIDCYDKFDPSDRPPYTESNAYRYCCKHFDAKETSPKLTLGSAQTDYECLSADKFCCGYGSGIRHACEKDKRTCISRTLSGETVEDSDNLYTERCCLHRDHSNEYSAKKFAQLSSSIRNQVIKALFGIGVDEVEEEKKE